MGSFEINEFCKINDEASKIIEKVYSKFSLSARAYSRILKVARTIADLKNSKKIDKLSLIEAIQYRKFVNNNII